MAEGEPRPQLNQDQVRKVMDSLSSPFAPLIEEKVSRARGEIVGIKKQAQDLTRQSGFPDEAWPDVLAVMYYHHKWVMDTVSHRGRG